MKVIRGQGPKRAGGWGQSQRRQLYRTQTCLKFDKFDDSFEDEDSLEEACDEF